MRTCKKSKRLIFCNSVPGFEKPGIKHARNISYYKGNVLNSSHLYLNDRALLIVTVLKAHALRGRMNLNLRVKGLGREHFPCARKHFAGMEINEQCECTVRT